MVGSKRYYRIPLITRIFKIRFFVERWDEKIKRFGFKNPEKMNFKEAFLRLESKRLSRENPILK